MAKSVKITFSKVHTSKNHSYPHADVHRQASDSSKNKKIDHNAMPTYNVKVNKK